MNDSNKTVTEEMPECTPVPEHTPSDIHLSNMQLTDMQLSDIHLSDIHLSDIQNGTVMSEHTLQDFASTLLSLNYELHFVPPFWNYSTTPDKQYIDNAKSYLEISKGGKDENGGFFTISKVTSIEDIAKPVRYIDSTSSNTPLMNEYLKQSNTMAKSIYADFVDNRQEWTECRSLTGTPSLTKIGTVYRKNSTGEMIYFKGGSIYEGADDFGGVLCVCPVGAMDDAIEDSVEFDKMVDKFYGKIGEGIGEGNGYAMDGKDDNEGNEGNGSDTFNGINCEGKEAIKLQYAMDRVQGSLRVVSWDCLKDIVDRYVIGLYSE